MANLKNWQPNMTSDERAWFDACPKAVLFEMARQFAMLAQGEENADMAFARMQEEWNALHVSGVVPQKPFSVEKAKLAALVRKEKLSGLRDMSLERADEAYHRAMRGNT